MRRRLHELPCADGTTVPALDVYGVKSFNRGSSWTSAVRLSDVTTNPNYEQFDNRTVPFAGDYLWVTSLADFAYGTWTDWRNTVQGVDPREGEDEEDGAMTSDLTTSGAAECRRNASSSWDGIKTCDEWGR